MSKPTGEAAPAKPAELEEIGDDIMSAAAGKLGQTLPIAKPQSERKPDASADDDESDDAGAEDDAKSKPGTESDDDGAAGDEDEGGEAEGKEAAGDEPDEGGEGDEGGEAEGKEAAGDEPDEGGEGDQGESKDEAEKTAAKLADETKQFVDVKLKDLPEAVRTRVQNAINARIGKITATAADEKVRLENRIEELAVELEETKAKGGAAPANLPGVHPLMFVDSESALDQRLLEIERFEDFADEYREGYEGDGTEKDPAWTAEQIRAKLRQVQRERDRIIPAARANLKARAAKDAELKQSYPALFDRKSEDYRAAQALAKLMPELNRHADKNVLLARLILGEKALADLGKAKTAAPKKQPPAVKKAPRVPGSGGPAKGSVVARPSGDSSTATSALNKAMQNPGDKRAFTGAVAALIGDL